MYKDLTGQKFGRLTVISRAERTKNGYKWNCVCDCGKNVSVSGCNLRNNITHSCGCYRKERAREAHLKHGDNRRNINNRLYRCWTDMRTRTRNFNSTSAHNYCKRGITCCAQWNNYINFKEWAINNGYNDNLTLDRIDVNGNYCPENCRWISLEEQAKNRRNTVKYKNIPVSTLCKEHKINYHTVMTAIYVGVKRGFTKNQILKRYFPTVKSDIETMRN